MIDLILSLYRLKDERRTGWLERGISDPESVADHSWGTALLCLIYGGAAGVDGYRAVSLSLVHDLAEAVTGDRPARFDTAGRVVPDRGKRAGERRAIERLFPPRSGELRPLRELWEEYERSESPEAAFVRDMNLVDMCIQALIYDTRPTEGGRGSTTRRLAEFFESTALRISTPVGRELFEHVWKRYRATPGDETASKGDFEP